MTERGYRAQAADEGIVLSVSVMTHLARRHRADWLLAHLADAGPRLAVDPEPDGVPMAARSAAVGWRQVAPGATHHLVLQDDVAPRPEFIAAVRDAVRLRPDAAWSFYCNGDSKAGSILRLAALWGCASFEPRDDYLSTLALVLPREHALGFSAHVESMLTESALTERTPDDVMLLDYCRGAGLRFWQTVPNLVEHEDGRSLMGNDSAGVRRAAYYDERAPGPVKPEDSALEIGEVPYFPFMRRTGDAEFCRTAEQPRIGSPSVADEIEMLGLTVESALAACRHDSQRVAARSGRADVDAALDRLGWPLWLVGATYGAVTRQTGHAVLAGESVVRELWRTLVCGVVSRRSEPPADEVVTALIAMVQAGFAAGAA